MKKKIKIKFVGFNTTDFSYNDIIKLLSDKYDVELSDEPDYLFYSVFSKEYLDYKNCIRIFFTGECIVPNFNECDYAIGFDRMDFGDRYLRMPLYSVFEYRNAYETLKDRKLVTAKDLKSKTCFCSFVVSNGFAAQRARLDFFEQLSKYKKVNSGGRFRNNIGGPVIDKIAFQKKHKFCICFENTTYSGYTTEKLVEAFASRTIPIYLGDPTVCEDFNEEAFVFVNNYKTFEDAINKVIELDNDDKKYLAMINAPIIKKWYNYDSFRLFLYNIFDQEYELAKRRPIGKDQIRYEDMLLRHRFFEDKIYLPYRRFRDMFKQIKNGTILSKKRTK